MIEAGKLTCSITNTPVAYLSYDIKNNKIAANRTYHFNFYNDKEELITVDHVHPKSKGGSEMDVDNLQPMVGEHNWRKSSQLDYNPQLNNNPTNNHTSTMSRLVVLPPSHIFETPMPLETDAYTAGSPIFNSQDALDKSVYYVTNRKSLNPGVDDRMIMNGLDRIIERIFRRPVTHTDIDECVKSLANFQVTADGFIPYPFPEALWRRVVDEFNGRPPIKISAVEEGSVIYPNEPFIEVESMISPFGDLAAWVESRLLQVYGSIEKVTRNEHFLEQIKDEILFVNPNMNVTTAEFIASTMLIDFSDRAGLNDTESEDLGLAQLLTFSGTDNLSGHYQAYKSAGNRVVGCSILALAHRNVQAFTTENECFLSLNKVLVDGGSGSFVADLNDYKRAIEEYLIPIVKSNLEENNRKTVVFRPDSGDVIEQILWTLEKCEEKGLTVDVIIGEEHYKSLLGCKLILADGLTMPQMIDIMRVVTNAGFIFWECVLFGSGGGLRNGLKRDNGSTKFYLAAMGRNLNPVCKFSEDVGKGTLPGPLLLIRDEEMMKKGITVVHASEEGFKSAYLVYFDGSNIWEPFGEGMYSNFEMKKSRIKGQMKHMPKFIKNEKYGSFPITDKLANMRAELKHIHAPNK